MCRQTACRLKKTGRPSATVKPLPNIMRLKASIVNYALLCIVMNSCIIPKDARVLKRTTREWRESQTVLHAWADTPFSGIFLTLRANGKFEHTSSGLFQSFEAGRWTNYRDTIALEYLDSKQKIIRTQNVTVDRHSSTLIFENDSTPVQFRLRVMKNKIE